VDQKILIIGATGMLGNVMMRVFSENLAWRTFGTVRSGSAKKLFRDDIASRLISDVDVENYDSLTRVFCEVRPTVVINCVGLVKQLTAASDPLQAIPINTMLPHRLSQLCKLVDARLIHISTDCVFSGSKGNYIETDLPDAHDLYGRSKYLGEVSFSHTITLRTSIIGHELLDNRSLVGWFLAQNGSCLGYTNAIFSGLPTVVLAQIIRDIVIPNENLFGVYHVASQPISKFNLLRLISDIYNKSIAILPDNNLVLDRSLNSERFRNATGYVAPEWPKLIKLMHDYQ
jgi:dTDP-4-dehydrorhamnose reductase